MTTDVADIARTALSVLPAPAPDLAARLAAYLRLLLEANEGVNLVSRKDTHAHVARFTHECLFLARLLSDELEARKHTVADPRGAQASIEPARLLDLGSGGGFPGLILKLAIPGAETTLVEGTQKKARFLADACRKLDLRGITVIWARAEALVASSSPYYKPALRRHFDWVTAKALGSLRESLDLAAPFLRPGGEHWTFKGPGYEAEVAGCRRRLAQLHCRMLRVERVPGDKESYVLAVQRQPDAPGNVSRETSSPE